MAYESVRAAKFCILCSRYNNDPSASTNLVLARDNANVQALQALEILAGKIKEDSKNQIIQEMFADCLVCNYKEPLIKEGVIRLGLISKDHFKNLE